MDTRYRKQWYGLMVEIDTSFDLHLPVIIKKSLLRTAVRLNSLNAADFINKPLAAPSKHLITANGKYVRPTLVFISASALKKNPADFIDLGASIELLHVASLVHDDIIDRDEVRRGMPAVHIKYGTEAAILAGDALISKSIQLSSKYGPEVIDAISHAAMIMCAGEMMDFRFQREHMIPSLKDYIKIAELKSASLIATAASIVAVHGNDAPLAKKLYEFGRDAGVAFQMRDDIFNFMGLNDSSKKSTGNDGIKFRPNIVEVLLNERQDKPEIAVSNAIELNNSAIDKALQKLDGTIMAKTFVDYANLIRVHVK